MAEIEKMEITELDVFQLPIDVTSDGTYKRILHTADTYVDKNIEVQVTVPDATFKTINEGAVTATANIAQSAYTTTTNTGYVITATADGSVSDIKVGIDQAGFASVNDTVTVSGSSAMRDTVTAYIKDGAIQAANATATSVGGNGVTLTASGIAPSSGFYITTTGTATASVKTDGWVDATHDPAITATEKTQYYTIASAELNNVAGDVADADYTTLTTPALTEGGNLYITEGYIKNTKISLADLVPDNANITSTNANLVYKTVKAYDNDGALIVGTMGDATLGNITATDVSADIESVSYAYDADSGKFNVTGSGDISGNSSVAIATNGYATTSLSKTGSISGSATVNTTVNKIEIGADKGADGAVTPVITKVTADTTAKSGALTTIKPADGFYIAVNTSEITQSTTVTPKVTATGYGTTENYTASAISVTSGANAAAEAYIPITAGSHTITTGINDITNATSVVSTDVVGDSGVTPVTYTEKTAGEQYITISGAAEGTSGSLSNTVTCTSVEGYIESGTKTTNVSGDVGVTITDAAPKYIKVYQGTFL